MFGLSFIFWKPFPVAAQQLWGIQGGSRPNVLESQAFRIDSEMEFQNGANDACIWWRMLWLTKADASVILWPFEESQDTFCHFCVLKRALFSLVPPSPGKPLTSVSPESSIFGNVLCYSRKGEAETENSCSTDRNNSISGVFWWDSGYYLSHSSFLSYL